MARVEVRGLTMRYGDVLAVDDVSLDVADGEFLVLLGPSGSGKSTILKLMAGIEGAESGEVWIDGGRVDHLLPKDRDVAMVFQSYALYPHMSVFANLAFPLRSAGVGRAEVDTRVRQTADLLGLGDLLDRRPGQLSGGQQQRVALGRAIVRRPKVFLMDEPLSNLDAKLRARTRLELSRLHDRLAATTVYVTHDQVEAMTMGHRIAVVDGGRIRQLDRPEVVYEHPADLVVADFVGSPPMNVVPGRLGPGAGSVRFSAPGLGLAWAAAALDPAMVSALPAEGEPVTLGVRPEYLHLGTATAGGPVGAGAGTDAVVERVELLGSERVVHVAAGATRLALKVPAALRPRPAERVVVTVDPAGVRMFDAGTGLLLGGPPPAGS